MIRFLVVFASIVTGVVLLLADPGGAMTLALGAAMTGLAIFIFRRTTDLKESKDFLTYLFLAALCVRLIMGVVIHVYDLRDFVGPDAFTYDTIGIYISDYWAGVRESDYLLTGWLSMRGPGWGMNYLMGILYYIFGQNIFLAQSFCAVFGAAIAPMAYFCAEQIFHNRRVSKTAALLTAFFPAFIIWSSQLLKDGLVVFLLLLAMTLVLRIQKKFTVVSLVLLILSLGGILSLRFYIFYMVGAAVLGSFVIGVSTSLKAITQRTLIIVAMGLGLTYLGVIRSARLDFDSYGSLDRAQLTRNYQSISGESGYASEGDVSTVAGALSAMPTGFAYLMFAPFPWEMKNLRQTLTLPDVLLWWALWPLIIYGFWYTIRHRLREAFPILLFTLMLTISYSVFQGNIGAAYRQRTQIQVFLFFLAAVGWSVLQERRADKKLVEVSRKRSLEPALRAGLRAAR